MAEAVELVAVAAAAALLSEDRGVASSDDFPDPEESMEGPGKNETLAPWLKAQQKCQSITNNAN